MNELTKKICAFRRITEVTKLLNRLLTLLGHIGSIMKVLPYLNCSEIKLFKPVSM